MNKILYLLAGILLVACAPANNANFEKPAASFMNALSGFCGNKYAGKVIFPADSTDPFAGKELVMYVQSCSDTEIKTPFAVGEDRSRTWLLTETPQGLQLKHDHRHEDGTPDEVTMYGGISTSSENSLTQQFPADAHTAQLIPAAATNEWTLAISPDGKTFSYILKRDNKMRFQADFDLTKPL